MAPIKMKSTEKAKGKEKDGQLSAEKTQKSNTTNVSSLPNSEVNSQNASGSSVKGASTVSLPMEKVATKAKQKTNKVAADFEERFACLESVVHRLVDALEDQNEADNDSYSEVTRDELQVHASLSELSEGELEETCSIVAKPTKPGKTDSKKSEATEDMGLAAKFAVKSDVGNPLDDKLAISVRYMIGPKMEDKTMQETADKYSSPENCDILAVPKVQPTIWDNIQTQTRSRDLKMQRVQKYMVKGVIALVQDMKPDSLSEKQVDALALMCHANFELNSIRKEFIKPDLNPKYAHLCKPSHPVSTWLFGDDLSQKVKDMKEEQKAAAGVMRASNKSSSNQRKRSASSSYNYPSPRRQRYSYSDSRRSTDRSFLGGSSRLSQWRRNYQGRRSRNQDQDYQAQKKDAKTTKKD